MQEVLGEVYNLQLDLEQIKLMSQEADELISGENALEQQAVARKKEEMKTYLRQWTERVENNVRHSNLPPAVVNEVLSLTQMAKQLGNMNAIHIIAQEVDDILKDVRREAEARSQQKQSDQALRPNVGPAEMVGTVIGGVVLAPFVQVRYSPEAYEEKSEEFVTEKLLPRLVRDDFRPVPPTRVYPTRRDDQRPAGVRQAEEKIADLKTEALKKKIQSKRTEAGLPPLSEDELNNRISGMGAFARRVAEENIVKDDPDAQKKIKQAEDEKEETYRKRQYLNLLKQVRKKYPDLTPEQVQAKVESMLKKRLERKADSLLKAGKVSVKKVRGKGRRKTKTKAAPRKTKKLSPTLNKRLIKVIGEKPEKTETGLKRQLKRSSETKTVKTVPQKPREEVALTALLARRKDYRQAG